MCIALPILAYILPRVSLGIQPSSVEFRKRQGVVHKLINWSIERFPRFCNRLLQFYNDIFLNIIRGFLILVCLLLPWTIFMNALNTGIDPARSTLDAVNCFYLYLIGFLTNFFILVLRLIIFQTKKSELPEKEYASILIFSAIMALLIQYVILFTEYIYPRVPEDFGGGAPSKVQLLLVKKKSEQIVKQLAIPTCNSNESASLSEPIILLFEGSEDYNLLINNRVVKIDKKMVIAEIPILEKTSQGLIKYLREQKNVQSGKLTEPNQVPSGACHLCRESDNKDSRSTLSTLL